MGATSVTAFDALAPVPEFSVLELAVVICIARRPGSDLASVVAEIGRGSTPAWSRAILRVRCAAWSIANGC